MRVQAQAAKILVAAISSRLHLTLTHLIALQMGTVGWMSDGANRHRFALSDVMGTTGAAPAEILDRLRLDFLGFPESSTGRLQKRAADGLSPESMSLVMVGS